MKSNYILITGCAGFIGFHLTSHMLINSKKSIIGIDNLNSYYDVDLKRDRLKILRKNKKFKFYKLNIADTSKISSLFKKYRIEKIVNLAAQAGVRFSINNREEYFNSNVKGFFNILEMSKKYKVKHLVYASTSSVYGNSTKKPFRENQSTDEPLSFYAASKKTNEILAYPYSYIHNIKISGMRFFSVYGPYGRPDMALYKFVDKMIKGKKIDLYNHGNHLRDFTYIDDVVKGIVNVLKKAPKKKIPFEIVNIGRGKPENLKDFLKVIKYELNIKKPFVVNKKMQLGDVYSTYASVNKLKKNYKYKPNTNINIGIKKCIQWYKKYNNII